MLALGIIIGACIVGASNVALAWVRKQEASAKANGLSRREKFPSGVPGIWRATWR